MAHLRAPPTGGDIARPDPSRRKVFGIHSPNLPDLQSFWNPFPKFAYFSHFGDYIPKRQDRYTGRDMP